MKKQIRKWAARLAATAIFILGLLIFIVLHPALLYAKKTVVGNYTIYYNKTLKPSFSTRLKAANNVLRSSALYNPNFKFDICLDDGSAYPGLIKSILGNGFAWGFYNKVVIRGNTDSEANHHELNGYRWNLVDLLAHEMTHCLQFDHYGFWKSNPVAGYPGWKWEGYPEYVARRNVDQQDLKRNIERLINTEKMAHNGWVQFEDGTGTAMAYYRDWILMQYCLEIRKMSYSDLLDDYTPEGDLRKEMMEWFRSR